MKKIAAMLGTLALALSLGVPALLLPLRHLCPHARTTDTITGITGITIWPGTTRTGGERLFIRS
jgi:hypothetical protein